MRQHLRERLATHPEIEIVGEAHGVRSAADLVATAKPDVIFLDVKMPPDSGFDLLPRLEWAQPRPAIVFVTAYDQFALKAFDAHALDYLTKPVHPERLAMTLERLKQSIADQWRAAKFHDQAEPARSQIDSQPLEAQDLIRLQDGAYIRMVKVGQIAAAEVHGDYTRIFSNGGKAVMVKSTPSLWEEKLPPSRLEDATSHLEDATSHLEDATSRLEDAPSRLEDAPSRLEDAPSRLEDAPSRLEDATSHLEDATSRLEDATTHLEDAPTRLEDAPILETDVLFLETAARVFARKPDNLPSKKVPGTGLEPAALLCFCLYRENAAQLTVQ